MQIKRKQFSSQPHKQFRLFAKMVALFCTLGFLLVPAESILAQGSAKKERLKRRVLILDFSNASKARGGEHLDLTIPDALIEHLQKTNDFIILRRDLAAKKAAKVMKRDSRYDVEKAIKVGDSANADVVVIGNYAIYNGYIQIQAKAIDVHSGEVPVVMTVQGRTDRNIFVTIQKLTRQVASKMSKELGPIDVTELPAKRAMYEQSLALNEKKQNRMLPSASIGFIGTFGLTDNAQMLEFGKGVRVAFTPTPLFNGVLNMYFEWNLWFSGDKYQNIPLMFNGIFAGTTYPVVLFPKFILSPFLLVGNYGGHVSNKSIFSIFATKVGLDMKYAFKENFGANVTVSLVSLHDDDIQMLLEFSAGVAGKF
ncbi:MAG: hypothetical protein ABUK01_01275 [Leptospirales bacterium]